MREQYSISLFALLLLSIISCSVDMGRERPGDVHIADKTKSDSQQPDTKKLDGFLNDNGGMPSVILVQSGFSTAGSGAGTTIVLVEGGFEMGEELCNTTKNICITGEIGP